jgi:periplasmic protein TonB
VPFSDLLDKVEITLGEDMPLDDDEQAVISLGESIELGDDERPEPLLAGAPLLIEFDEPARLDPERVGLTWEVPAPARSGMRLRSSASALAIHLLPLLLIITWPTTTTEVPVIPVQLVIEQPPPDPPQPPPQPQPQQPQPPPPPSQPKTGRLASDDLGSTKAKAPGTASQDAQPSAGEKQPQPSTTQTAATTATPPPLPPPKPAPPRAQSPAAQPPKPSGAVTPHHDETPHEAPRQARYDGPASARDEYLAYLVTLTRQHIDLLPMSFIGSRKGETIVTVDVQDNGTITRISVSRGSGYPDIDERIEQMVAAVRKFPPVPQWFQGSTLELQLTMRFPEAIEGRD